MPNWQAALDSAVKDAHRRAILTLLKFCKEAHVPVTVALIRSYLKTAAGPEAREALRWFYKTALEAARDQGGNGQPEATPARSERAVAPVMAGAGGRRGQVPPLASEDRGGADWERDLIRAVRKRGFSWRTEETYRMWAARFAAFIRPRSPYTAGAEEVAAFLSALAVEQRAAPSTRKQALNAVVFFLQEALHRQLGEIDFRRAAPRQRMPVVLSREECRRLFGQLEGTVRLMTELMYGSGLRLMELLRLRVQHLDLERGRIKVAGGKGNKDRITVLPAALVGPLRAHLERLRELHAADRAAGLPGVWLPEGLARKYPKAGGVWGQAARCYDWIVIRVHSGRVGVVARRLSKKVAPSGPTSFFWRTPFFWRPARVQSKVCTPPPLTNSTCPLTHCDTGAAK